MSVNFVSLQHNLAPYSCFYLFIFSMMIVSFHQTFFLTFLVWLSTMVLVNCTPASGGESSGGVSEQGHAKSPKRVDSIDSKQYNYQRTLRDLSELSGQLAKHGQKVAEKHGEDDLKKQFSHISKTAGKSTSFHISKVNRMEGGQEGNHFSAQKDYKMHSRLAQMNIAAGKSAKIGREETKFDYDPYYYKLFTILGQSSGKVAAYHVSKAKQLAQPAPGQAST
jgi:hypothetical protein